MAFTFYERIIGNPNKINVEALAAAITENCADRLSLEAIETAFSLNTAESNSLQQCINLICSDPPTMDITEMHGIFNLAETGVAYNTESTLMARLSVTL